MNVTEHSAYSLKFICAYVVNNYRVVIDFLSDLFCHYCCQWTFSRARTRCIAADYFKMFSVVACSKTLHTNQYLPLPGGVTFGPGSAADFRTLLYPAVLDKLKCCDTVMRTALAFVSLIVFVSLITIVISETKAKAVLPLTPPPLYEKGDLEGRKPKIWFAVKPTCDLFFFKQHAMAYGL